MESMSCSFSVRLDHNDFECQIGLLAPKKSSVRLDNVECNANLYLFV